MVKSQYYNPSSLDDSEGRQPQQDRVNGPSSSRSLQQQQPKSFSRIKHGLPLLATFTALAHLRGETPSMATMLKMDNKLSAVYNMAISGGNYSNKSNHSEHHSNSTISSDTAKNETIAAITSTSPAVLEATSKEEAVQATAENTTKETISPAATTPIPSPPIKNSSTIFINGLEWVANQTYPPNNGQPTIFSCHNDGNAMGEFRSILMDVLPEYRFVSLLGIGRNQDLGTHGPWLENLTTTPNDVFITHGTAGCPVGVDRWRANPQQYKGRFIITSGEDTDIPKNMENITLFWGPRNPTPDNQHHVLRLTYLQSIFWFHFRRHGRVSNTGTITPAERLFDFPRNTAANKPHFLIYGQSNCVPYREEAFDRISEIAPVHIGGKCRGRTDSINKTSVATHVNLFNWWNNVSGVLPISILFGHGTFQFVGLWRGLPILESNASAYDAVMKEEPVLAHGEETIRDYFSFSDDVGGGVLKAKMRSMLGLSNTGFSMSSVSNDNNPGSATRLRRALRGWLG